MRTLLVLLLILALIAGGIWAYLVVTTPKTSAGVTFPLSSDHRALLARVPASADSFALIPTAAVLHRKLLANPVTKEPVEQWTDGQDIPNPWMLGGADIVAWRDGKRTSYALRVDAFRAFLVRVMMMWSSGNVDARWDGTMFVINGNGGALIPARALDPIVELANGLPPGDMLVVQRNRARGAFPPIGRPAVTSVKVSEGEILSTSRAESGGGAAALQGGVAAALPEGAMLAVTFSTPPRLLGELQRLLGANLTELGSGTIALYDIDTGTLLPRPKGVIAVPREKKAALGDVIRAAELVGDHQENGKELLLSFDRKSLPLYLKDTFVPTTLPATSWSARVDPRKLVPVLRKLGDSRGLQIAAGRLHRAARDLRNWISFLEKAESIEAAASSGQGFDELRVRIASK
jgi:hypothetical protein